MYSNQLNYNTMVQSSPLLDFISNRDRRQYKHLGAIISFTFSFDKEDLRSICLLHSIEICTQQFQGLQVQNPHISQFQLRAPYIRSGKGCPCSRAHATSCDVPIFLYVTRYDVPCFKCLCSHIRNSSYQCSSGISQCSQILLPCCSSIEYCSHKCMFRHPIMLLEVRCISQCFNSISDVSVFFAIVTRSAPT